MKEQNKFSEAINSLQKAILLKPDYAEANFNLANIYKDQGKIQKGIDTYKKALLINPNYEIARAEKLHQLAYICDWKNIEEDSKFIPLLGTNKQFISPFSILALEDAPNRHRVRSEKYVKARHPKNTLPQEKPPHQSMSLVPTHLTNNLAKSDENSVVIPTTLQYFFEIYQCIPPNKHSGNSEQLRSLKLNQEQ